jgi:tRNA-Thr(GGU) m(6)t(6)A37 methyltransferase TsaA
MKTRGFTMLPIGRVQSSLKRRAEAPRQGSEGAPEAKIEIFPKFGPAIEGIIVGSEIIIVTWLHKAERDVLKVHPRGDRTRLLTGVFATRSPDRPNPLGLHRVKVLAMEKGGRLTVQGLEAIDKTPIVDIKPVLDVNDW